MAQKKLTVVISQAQGKNPVKQELEQSIAAAMVMADGIDVSLVPNLYDMPPDHSGMLYLRGVPTDMVVLSWHFPRASRWMLDRQGVRGLEGHSLLNDPEEEPIEPFEPSADAVGASGLHEGPTPNRRIYTIDLREHADADVFIDECKRIAKELSTNVVSLDLGSFSSNGNGTAPSNGDASSNGNGQAHHGNGAASTPQPTNTNGSSPNGQRDALDLLPSNTIEANGIHEIKDAAPRRWYPVIDYSRCTNCMECIDFCLFGVYGVDKVDQILVEAQDNCKKGCPACSRVCPENAIIFPQHKTPAIAGADGEVAGVKIDLSKLFGGMEADPLKAAVAERDAELVADGRDAVGMSIGVPKRQTNTATKPRDDLDDLMDDLDSLDF